MKYFNTYKNNSEFEADKDRLNSSYDKWMAYVIDGDEEKIYIKMRKPLATCTYEFDGDGEFILCNKGDYINSAIIISDTGQINGSINDNKVKVNIPSSGIYTVQFEFKSDINGPVDFSGGFSNTNIKSINSGFFDALPTEINNAENLFAGCKKLITIPEDLFNNTSPSTSFSECFQSCTHLENIPSGLFYNNSESTDFNSCFQGCTSISEIPENLFYKNVMAEDFSYCFDGCQGISTISSVLFSKNRNAKSFKSCFPGLNKLLGIPTELFSNNTQATSFQGCFAGCTNIMNIPDTLFMNNTKVTTFASCFSGCTNISSIPTELFFNNAKVTDFSSCFAGCTNITNIPSQLFSQNPLAESFDHCFERTSITSVPDNLFGENGKTFSYCFQGCAELTDVGHVFSNCANSENFSNCFDGCSNITLISRNVFLKEGSAENESITDFSHCFDGCNKMRVDHQTDPGNLALWTSLYSGVTALDGCQGCFYGCGEFETQLSSLPGFDWSSNIITTDTGPREATPQDWGFSQSFDPNTLQTGD